MDSTNSGSQPAVNGKLEIKIWRGRASDGAFSAYEVPEQAHQTVLDVVTYVQRRIDATLAYRFACRVGMCGSCAMTVNGVPRWTCRTDVKTVARKGRLVIEPLRNLPVVKDLVTDMAPFFDKWQAAEGRLHATADRGTEVATIDPATPERKAADAGVECINCAVCYSACDVVTWNPDYLGPAALNRAWTLQNDERDGGKAERLRAVTRDGGCQNCHSHQSCTEHCPVGLSPTASIAGLKRMAARAAFGRGSR